MTTDDNKALARMLYYCINVLANTIWTIVHAYFDTLKDCHWAHVLDKYVNLFKTGDSHFQEVSSLFTEPKHRPNQTIPRLQPAI